MRALITRPADEAADTVMALDARGHAAVVSPLLTIRFLPVSLPEGPFDGLVATSGNGVAALLAHAERARVDGLPLHAVGARTAAIAREAGLAVAAVADGDTTTLDRMLQDRLPVPARLLHLAGRDRARDIGASLPGFRHEVRVIELYAAEIAPTLQPEAAALLESGGIDAVLHYSARTADAWLAAARGLTIVNRERLRHVCLSERVAERLRLAGEPVVMVAARRDEAAMLDCLDRDEGESAMKGKSGRSTRERSALAGKAPAKVIAASPAPEAPDPATVPGDGIAPDAPAAAVVDVDTPRAETVDANATTGTAPVSDAPASEPVPPEAMTATISTPITTTPITTTPMTGGTTDAPGAPAAGVAATPPPQGEPPRHQNPGHTLPLAAGFAGGILGALLLFALQSAGLMPAPGGNDTSMLDALRAEVESLKARPAPVVDLSPVEAAAAEARRLAEQALSRPSGAVDLGPLTARLDAADAGRAALQQSLDSGLAGAVETVGQVRAAVDALQSRVTALESVASIESGGRAAALSVGLTALAGAVESGRPFAAEFRAVSALVPGDATLATLQPLAERGAPTLAGVTASFRTAVPILEAALDRLALPPEPGLLDRALNAVSGIVTIRRTGEATAEASEPLRRALAALEAGDLAGAIIAYDTLDPRVREAGADWRAEADAAAAAAAAVVKLRADALAALGG